MFNKPIVSVIIPTTRDRKEFNDRILANFIKQDYPYKHLVFDFEDGTIGEKRNRCCDKAFGDILIHFDSDDNYATDWITRSVTDLIDSKCDIIGLNKFYLVDSRTGDFYLYTYHKPEPWVAGATMCYWKTTWQRNLFPDKNIGEDAHFIWDSKKTLQVGAHDYMKGFVATIHPKNTSKKFLQSANYHRCDVSEEAELTKLWKPYM